MSNALVIIPSWEEAGEDPEISAGGGGGGWGVDEPPAFGNGSLKRHLCSKRRFRNIFLKLPTRVCVCVCGGGGGEGGGGGFELSIPYAIR